MKDGKVQDVYFIIIVGSKTGVEIRIIYLKAVIRYIPSSVSN